MASPDLTARLRYLNDSAHLLATTAPATSKYLMSQRNSLMFDNGIDRSDPHRRDACGACGTIVILGWDGKIETRRQGGSRGKSGKAVTNLPKPIVYMCESCGRKTQLNISTSPSSVLDPKPISLLHTKHTLNTTQASNHSSSGLSNSQIKSQPITTSSCIPSETSTKKKRTKTRNQGGLGAIIARQKATESRGLSGFDLLDFMKKA